MVNVTLSLNVGFLPTGFPPHTAIAGQMIREGASLFKPRNCGFVRFCSQSHEIIASEFLAP